ncbi:MAG: OmpA family protein [Rhodobacteraceae bacterium]|nr:OmpA family protein [Paracoccaceae bacterium]
MQRLALFIGALLFALALAGAYLGASLVAAYVERASVRQASAALAEGGYGWASVRADGLALHVSGPAPDEAARLNALSEINKVVAAARVRDAITIVESDALHAPKFSLELLRNGDGISLIGLIPAATGREAVLQSIADLGHDTSVTDMLEATDYPEPEDWKAAVDYALDSLRLLPRSKLSVTPGRVVITAITDSQADKTRIETLLSESRPEGVAIVLKISAPRPVITPFSLRLIIDERGARFDSCSADTEDVRQRILAAARAAGFDGTDNACTIGLGAPSPRWGEAVVLSIRALKELGGGSLTFADADVTLVAQQDARQIDFDRIVYNLEQDMPDVFSVHAVLPPKPVLEGQNVASEPPEFLATRSPEGLVQMRGRNRNERSRLSTANFARALFGGDNVHDTTRVDSSLPDGWPLRVLVGIEALGKLHHGVLTVHEDMLEIRGITDNPEARTEITQLLSDKLGDASRYQISVTYDEALNQVVIPPTPEECVAAINAILAERQIVFAPSSTRIEGEAQVIISRIAEAMVDCSDVRMEIGGHTDSQGREAMNQTLSQARAEAVLDALLSREVLTSFLTAKGYGEAHPIADNDTEEGRAANRRIEFRLLDDASGDGTAEDDSTGDEGAATDDDAGGDSVSAGDDPPEIDETLEDGEIVEGGPVGEDGEMIEEGDVIEDADLVEDGDGTSGTEE